MQQQLVELLALRKLDKWNLLFLYLPRYFVPDAKIQHGSTEFMLGKLNLPQPTFLHLPKYLLNQMQKQNVATVFVLNKYGNINDLFKMAPHS